MIRNKYHVLLRALGCQLIIWTRDIDRIIFTETRIKNILKSRLNLRNMLESLPLAHGTSFTIQIDWFSYLFEAHPSVPPHIILNFCMY